MKFEEKIFKKYKPDFNKIKENSVIERIFKNKNFKAIITISKDKIKGKVIDLDSDDEFLPLRNENNVGAFVGEIREEYKNILIDIRNNYFYKNNFVLAQSNRICDFIYKKYNLEPEFLWEKFDGTGIFRNPKTDKWFGIIMDIDKSKIEKSKKGFIEVMNVKATNDTIEKCLKIKGFYPAYHMNKKYWLTFALDDTVSDDRIFELIKESYNLVDKK